jgi:hypothetical protein
MMNDNTFFMKKAIEAKELLKNLESTFDEGNKDEHLMIVLMAAMKDAFNRGVMSGKQSKIKR